MGLPLVGGDLKVSNFTQFWTESGISREFVEGAISNSKCFTNSVYLAACRAALKVAKRSLDLNQPEPLVEDDFNSLLERVENSKREDKPKEVIFGDMYNAFLHAFDPHSLLLPIQAFDTLISPQNEARLGAGVHLLATDAGVFVRAMSRMSPGYAAGLRVYDKLVRVGTSEVGSGVAGYRNGDLLQGKAGEILDVLVERAGQTKRIALKIGLVNEENIETEIISFKQIPYLYVRLALFREDSCSQLKKKIAEVKSFYQGMILDLRDNLGGMVEEGVCIGGLFVGRKDIVGQKAVPVQIPLDVGYRPDPDGNIKWQASFRSAVFDKVPLVVLLNSTSASTTEFVAGALQDYKMAWIVGERSFGKGTVQIVQRMAGARQFRLGFTSSMFYRPNGNTNQLNGVTPNFEVPMRRKALPEERRYPREGDLYANALKPAEGELLPWKETRPEAEPLRRCAEAGLDVKASELLQRKNGSEDYQHAYALAVLSCITQPPKHNP